MAMNNSVAPILAQYMFMFISCILLFISGSLTVSTSLSVIPDSIVFFYLRQYDLYLLSVWIKIWNGLYSRLHVYHAYLEMSKMYFFLKLSASLHSVSFIFYPCHPKSHPFTSKRMRNLLCN